MKFSVRQVLASAAGAVIAAIIASAFGVKGTIVGVAIGSAAATLGTAFVAQSIERGHEAVKQVVVRPADGSPLLRRLGSTGASGGSGTALLEGPVEGSHDASAAPTEVMRGGAAPGGSDEPGEFVESGGARGGDASGRTQRLEVSAAASAPEGERLTARTLPARQAARRFSWRTMGATAGVVFLLALGFITAIELISGNPLSDIFGDAGTGTSLNNVFSPSSPPPTTAPTTTSTTAPASTSTTTTASSSTTTTSTTAVRSSTTTTTAPVSTTTTTASPSGNATSTTASGAHP